MIRPIDRRAGLFGLTDLPGASDRALLPGNIVASTLMKALAPVLPKNVSAGVGNLKVAAYSGLIGENYWVYMDITGRLWRALRQKVLAWTRLIRCSRTRNNPIEDIEAHYPLRVTRYELLEDRGGPAGGAAGLARCATMRFLSDGRGSLEGEGNKYAPWGFAGGRPGTPGAVTLLPAGGGAANRPAIEVPVVQVRRGRHAAHCQPVRGRRRYCCATRPPCSTTCSTAL
ncbi:MAG: hydantoinase B/oxoprolinase family protein [Kouleothrix sp.]